jgi:hypothetical protein
MQTRIIDELHGAVNPNSTRGAMDREKNKALGLGRGQKKWAVQDSNL